MTAWKGIVGKRFDMLEFRGYLDTLTRPTFPEFVVLHNTQVPTLAQWTGEGEMGRLERYYRDDVKWSGGPHLFIDDQGIWAFTPLGVPGVHSPSWNAVSWGVELVGDYDTEQLSEGVLNQGLTAIADLHLWMGWGETRLKLHKDDPKTEHTYCPGKNIRREQWVAGIQVCIDCHK